MGLISDIASFFGAAQKKKAVERASNEQVAYGQQGIDATTQGRDSGIDALMAALQSATGTFGQAQELGTANIAGGVSGGANTIQGQRDLNQQIRETIQRSLDPYSDPGAQASGARADLLGLNGGGAQSAGIAGLESSPLFEALMRNGTNAALSGGSATGNLRGGNIRASLADMGKDTLAQLFQGQIGNLNDVIGTGLSATGQRGSALTSFAGLDSGLASNIGSMQANGGSNIAQLIQSLAVGQAGAQLNTGANIANLDAGTAAQIAALLGGQGAARAGGILGKTAAGQQMGQAVSSGIGNIAAALAGAPGGGGGGSQMLAAFI